MSHKEKRTVFFVAQPLTFLTFYIKISINKSSYLKINTLLSQVPRVPQMRKWKNPLVVKRKHQQCWTAECGLNSSLSPLDTTTLTKLGQKSLVLLPCFPLVSCSPLVTFCCQQRSESCGSTATFNCSSDYSHSMPSVKQPLSKQELSHSLPFSEAVGCVLPHLIHKPRLTLLKYTELPSPHSTVGSTWSSRDSSLSAQSKHLFV